MVKIVKDVSLTLGLRTRPEVSKLTPENTRNSQVAKLSPAESRLKHNDRQTKTMNSF